MNFFKKEKNVRDSQEKKVKKVKEKEMNYEMAKDEFFDMYMKQAKALNSWKMAFFFMCLLFAFILSANLYLTTRSELKPYIVKVLIDTDSGKVLEVSTAKVEKYNPQEIEREKYIKDLITRMRTIPRDEILISRNYKINYNYWFGKASKEKYREMFIKEKVSSFIKEGYARDIKFISFNRIAGSLNSYQIRWQEETYNKEGEKVANENMLGVFSIKIKSPTSILERDNNIYGIIVEDFTISKEN